MKALPMFQTNGQSEIHQLQRVVVGVDHYILWLDVSVDDPLAVHVVDSLQNLSHVNLTLLLCERSILTELFEELASRDVLHDDVEAVLVSEILVHLHDVGVVEGLMDLHLVLKDLFLVGVEPVFRYDLQGPLGARRFMNTEPDLGVSARSNNLANSIVLSYLPLVLEDEIVGLDKHVLDPSDDFVFLPLLIMDCYRILLTGRFRARAAERVCRALLVEFLLLVVVEVIQGGFAPGRDGGPGCCVLTDHLRFRSLNLRVDVVIQNIEENLLIHHRRVLLVVSAGLPVQADHFIEHLLLEYFKDEASQVLSVVVAQQVSEVTVNVFFIHEGPAACINYELVDLILLVLAQVQLRSQRRRLVIIRWRLALFSGVGPLLGVAPHFLQVEWRV
eukprot:CAMPEP_0170502296 /NCGR_PEP_ID=MMETSP0208-20121228/41095_1 /TAXON_ID=197538 /ORGANISM="Strombidium inclinatum, Strain S3" /LENGTH=387 /DNA_ID=CAMNT_0010781297 /DNA_START=870 /DNA_END=2033 /DNA_ORIENTATION=+